MNRREFIGKAAASVATAITVPQIISCGRNRRDSHNTIRDCLWMWGHEPESINHTPNLPKGGVVGMVDAIRWMGIPNVCAINHGDVVEIPYSDEYIYQFKDVKNVAWSIMSGPEWAPQYDKVRKYSHDKLIEAGIELLDKMPNLNEFYLDDFFAGDGIDEATGLSNAHMSIERLKKLRATIQTLKRQPKLTVVLYTSQINPGMIEYINCFDKVSLWTWMSEDLSDLEENFRKYREWIPDKPTLLGIYMWDFGNLKTISLEMMKQQLDFAYKKLIAGEVEGLIFHCTPLCGVDLEAVHYSKQWIAEHGDEIIPRLPYVEKK